MHMRSYARGKMTSSFVNIANNTVSAQKFVNNARTELTWDRIFGTEQTGHFTVVYSVTRPINDSEAAGDLVLVQTSLFLSCK